MATPLSQVVAASDAVAELSRRKEKTAVIAALLARLGASEIAPAVGWLAGEPRQGRIGVGWATLSKIPAPDAVAPGDAPDPNAPGAPPGPTVGEFDQLFEDVQATTGPGSQARRLELISALLTRCGPREDAFARQLLGGELRQGALSGVMTEAIAKASGVPATVVRRAHMLCGDLPATARLALTEGRTALEAVGLTVGRAVEPMLASTSESAAIAVADLGRCSVEWKLDGARIQVHRSGDDVAVFTRNLNEVGDRLPEVVRVALSLPVESVVLDGETLALDVDERPRAFQDTMSTFGREDKTAGIGLSDSPDQDGTVADVRLLPFFFDCLHVDGADLIDQPLEQRQAVLQRIAADHRIRALDTDDPAAAERFFDDAVARGHEGVMVKEAGSLYAAGRRGKAWRKVKPVHTLDLVVLAAEWGHGRRQGRLSNLHLGARGHGGEFIMVGKTFKGLTDELLEWQTEQFLNLQTGRDSHVVHVRPELVVEIAVDGAHTSTRYAGEVALRFARVKRYRPDKSPEDADTIETVRALR